jgi:signal transduction histidine kinase
VIKKNPFYLLNSFFRLRLRTQLLAAVTFLVITALVSFAFFSLQQQRKFYMMEFNNATLATIEAARLALEIGLKDENYEAIGTVLRWVKENENVEFIALVDESDEIVAIFPDSSNFSVAFIRQLPTTLDLSKKFFVREGTWTSATTGVGRLYIGFSTKYLTNAEKKTILNMFGVVFLVVFVGLIITYYLAKEMTKPLERLKIVTEKISNNELSVRADSDIGSQEIQSVAMAFNHMINQLLQTQKQRLDEMESYNKSLSDQNKIIEEYNVQILAGMDRAKQDLINLQIEKQRTEEAMVELKSTQAQLIQAEKMASLGALTAGIAHEIQNPLNFVNNFSEVSSEMLDEMEEELDKGDFEEAKFIAADVKENLKKIMHHGKRADSIVKGMLQHSRASTSEKELTDINALADEYLRLSYHGLRAKDRSFNCEIVNHIDSTIEKIYVVPQEIGRVLLNLFTNSFYAVTEKKKQIPIGYQPTITLQTEKIESGVRIKVSDNGSGIPEHIKEKIFQPFFTTKPTGQGTGLGLSLSYDIVTKGHGGTISVESESGVGTTFTINLPVKQLTT